MKYIHDLHGFELKGGKCWNPHRNVKTCLIWHTLIPKGSVSLHKNRFLIKTESHLTSSVFMNVTPLEVDKMYICHLHQVAIAAFRETRWHVRSFWHLCINTVRGWQRFNPRSRQSQMYCSACSQSLKAKAWALNLHTPHSMFWHVVILFWGVGGGRLGTSKNTEWLHTHSLSTFCISDLKSVKKKKKPCWNSSRPGRHDGNPDDPREG